MTRPDRPPWLEAEIVELMRAAGSFAALPVPEEAPDDGYQYFGPGCWRIYFREVRRLRRALDAIRHEWRHGC